MNSHVRIGTGRRIGGAFAMAALMASTCLAGAVVGPAAAWAQGAQQVSFDIPAGPLSTALTLFARQSGLQVTYLPALAAGKSSAGASGPLGASSALAAILQGSGLTYSLSGDTVTITERVAAAPDAGIAADGSTVLDTINVEGGGEQTTVYTPFETAAAASHIPAERIERFRGSSPADIFRGTPGVLSGEARNGAGAVDMNIRGMQGMGRVRVTVDGAENALQISQGYQGISNRTFLDPDLIAGVDVVRGADVSSHGIAGSVALRSLNADDIVKPGDTWGLRVRGGFGTNTSTPKAGAQGGYAWPRTPGDAPVAVPSPDGMDRPGFLTPTSGSGSIVGAIKQEGYDLFAGYAYRKQGNYHAGRHGAYANPVNRGPQTICDEQDRCQYWPDYVENTGIANFRPGEEVLNTGLETQSWLAKARLRLTDEHTLDIGYTGYRSEAGDRLASRLTGNRSWPIQQEQTSGVGLDTGTLRYRWQPFDNDLVDLTGNLWVTHLRQRNAPRNWGNIRPEDYGLPADFRVGSNSLLWGGDVANTSRFDLADYGSLDLTYGASYMAEDTKPTLHSLLGPFADYRDAGRQEAGAFAKAAWKPFDWLTLNAGLRYSHYWSNDRAKYSGSIPASLRERDEGGLSPSLGVTVEPWDGVQLYANWASAMRLPSIVETGSTFVVPSEEIGLGPERNNSWDIGANLVRDGLVADNDSAMLKLGYFNWDVKDYISREWGRDGSGIFAMRVHNIHRARFSGLELTGRYELGGFTAELNANYYLDVEFCRTAGTCGNATLYADYATNQVPPEYSVDLSLSQKLFDDRFTVGGRVLHVGPRAAGHGRVTGTGMLEFISLVSWKPYTLVDVFAEYKINDSYTLSARVENLFDTYYVDPLSLVRQPGPGRTFYASLTGTFGGDRPIPHFSAPLIRDLKGTGTVDWTGAYAGFHLGSASARTWGNTTTLDGADASEESADEKFISLMAGVQAGYNWQFGNGLVLGVEADLSKTDFRGSRQTLATDGPYAGTPGYLQSETHYQIDWTASFRARVGYAKDRWLVYGTGGLALAHETQWRDQYRSYGSSYEGGYTHPDSLQHIELSDIEKDRKTRLGYTLGGGVEYAINDRWSVTGNYSYSWFARNGFNFNNARAGVGRDYTTREIVGWEPEPPFLEPGDPLCDEPGLEFFCEPGPDRPIYETTQHEGPSSVVNGRKASNALDFHSFKIGLNYRF